MSTSNPRIGIIGGGAIGGFYGAMLARAGLDVHFLLRSEFPAIAKNGLLIQSDVHGELRAERINAYNDVEHMPRCDWLLIGTKSTGNGDLVPLIVRLAAPQAKIVVLQNGLDNEDQLRPLLPDSLHLIGCPCYVGVQRKAPGVIRHVALGDVHLGYHSGPADTPQTKRAILDECAALFQTAGIKTTIVSELAQARWHKLLYNIPYNGLSVLLDSGTDALQADPDCCELIRDLMKEVVVAATQCGYPLSLDAAERTLSMSRRMPDYQPSMYLDYVAKRPMELAAIYEAPITAARKAGCEMPKAAALYRALRFMDARNRQ